MEANPASAPRRRSSAGWLVKTVVVGCIVVFGLAGIVGVTIVLILFPGLRGGSSLEGKPYVSNEYNYEYLLPPEPWKLDNDLRLKMNANLALRHTVSPSATTVLIAKEYKKGIPRDGVVADEGVRRLRGYFEDFEYEPRDDQELAGVRAQRLIFVAVEPATRIDVRGECYMLFHQGIAYWLATWAPTAVVGDSKKQFSEMRQRFTLLNKREGWKGSRPKPQTFAGAMGNYTLQDTEGIWEKREPATDYDLLADLALHGVDKDDPKTTVNMAQILVLLLKAQAGVEPQTVAREYILEHHKKLYASTTATVVVDTEKGPQDKPGGVGNVDGHLLKLHITNTKDRQRFAEMAVVQQGDQIVVIYGECDLERRSLWERDFGQLIASFKAR